MKRIEINFLVVCFLFFQSSFSQTIWEQKNPMPPATDYNDIFFVDAMTGWALGDRGVITKTADGGVSWERQYAHYSASLYSSFFVNEATGWVAGRELYKTEDGGETWEFQKATNTYYSYHSLFFTDDSIGWMVSQGLYKTSDGGNDWVKLDSGNMVDLKEIYFIDEYIGWGITYLGEILKTTNGGVDWIIQASFELTWNFNSLFFIDESNGWVSADSGLIYRTNNGGDTWDTIQLNTTDYIIAVKFFDTICGRAASSENCYLTMDGGNYWQEYPLDNYGNKAFSFPTLSSGFAAGSYSSGRIEYSNDSCVSWQSINNGFEDDLHCAYMIDEETIVVAGEDGHIFKTIDAGNTWNPQYSTTNHDIQDVFFIDENNGWVVGNLGTLLKTTNGGQDWINVNVNDNYNYHGITFIDSLSGWFVTGGGKVFKTIDGGQEWIDVISGGPIALFDVCFVNEIVGWVVGNNGTIKKTMDGGLNWEVQEAGITFHLYAVSFVNENKGWICGHKVILQTDNGGLDWKTQLYDEDGPYLIFNSIQFSDESNGWACGNYGYALHTTNGGLNWVNQYTGIINAPYYSGSEDFYNLAFYDQNYACLVGEKGVILTTADRNILGPFILEQPNDTAICLGDSVSFMLDVIGDSLNFYWMKTGDPIENNISNPLVIDPVTDNDGDLYKCKVYSDAGFVTSEEFMVSVSLPVEITTQPSEITASVNDYVVFNQAITGSMPINYQWQKDGIDIPGANFHTYPIQSVQMSDSGMYRCLISNYCNEVITNEAKLSVIPESGIFNRSSDNEFSVFPNPVTDELHIRFSGLSRNGFLVYVFDVNGNQIIERDFTNFYKDEAILNLANLKSGLYFLQIVLDQQFYYQKIIKN